MSSYYRIHNGFFENSPLKILSLLIFTSSPSSDWHNYYDPPNNCELLTSSWCSQNDEDGWYEPNKGWIRLGIWSLCHMAHRSRQRVYECQTATAAQTDVSCTTSDIRKSHPTPPTWAPADNQQPHDAAAYQPRDHLLGLVVAPVANFLSNYKKI